MHTLMFYFFIYIYTSLLTIQNIQNIERYTCQSKIFIFSNQLEIKLYNVFVILLATLHCTIRSIKLWA